MNQPTTDDLDNRADPLCAGEASDPSHLPAHLQGLNPPQLEAVTHFLGPILVLAGAGSGKTRVLTRRVVSLIVDRKIHPRSILAVTFTNKATDEMRERLSSLLGSQASQLWIATFHSAALRILRGNARLLSYSNDFVVYDDQDSKSVIKSLLKQQGIDEKKFPVDTFSRAIDQAKNSYLSPRELAEGADGYEEKQIAEVYDHYQRALLKANAMDFGDLLFNVVRLFQEFPAVLESYRNFLHFILVDEFQDTNKVQYMLVKMLAEPRRNLLVVGDDDQSIYAFRGATVQNILEFEKSFPDAKVVKLEQNYRSTQTILELANSVIARNKTRKAKRLWTSGVAGDRVRTWNAHDEGEEAEFIARQIEAKKREGRTDYKDIAVFYRTNAQSRALEEALSMHKIPYRIFGGLKFYDRKEIKDILGYLKVIVNEADSQAFLRVINTPPRGIGAQTVQAIVEEARASGGSMVSAARIIARRSKGVHQFMVLYDELKKLVETSPPSEIINAIIEKSGYHERLKSSKDSNSESRIENLQELKAIAMGMELGAASPGEAVRTLLDRVALASSADLPEEQQEQDQKVKPDMVSLMTLHLAKGLEFPVVFLTGLEEGLIPHYRSVNDRVAIEEERRLCYVGITRAMRELYLTRTQMRGLFAASSGSAVREVSRFYFEMNPDCLTPLNGDFEQSLLSYQERSDDDDEELSGSWRRSRGDTARVGSPSRGAAQSLSSSGRRTLDRRRGGFSGVMTADQLHGSPRVVAAEPPKATGESAELSDLQIGTRVGHATFGYGVVQALEADSSGDLGRTKITVRFDSLSEPKKFIFKFAKLLRTGQ